MKIHVAGENALIVYFAEAVSDSVSQQIQHVANGLQGYVGDVLIDLVPSYASMLVIFNPLKTDHLHVRSLIRQAMHAPANREENNADNTVYLPVYYGPEVSPDLELIAANANLTREQVIEIHKAGEYRVYAIGFAPGFAYLGETDARIAAPRLATPRKKVPKGAVAIADRQTAVYPAVSPGGWNLIGCCPTPMFNPDATPTMPVAVADKVKFYEIDREEFLKLGGDLSTWGQL